MPAELKNQTLTAASVATESWSFLRTPAKSALRKFAFALHKWLGAFAAIYFIVMSASGVSLVFHDEIAEFLNPAPPVVIGTRRAKLNEIVQNVQQQFPSYEITGLTRPKRDDRPIDVFAANKDGDSINTEVDPYTGKVLGIKKQNETLKFLRQLHFNLLNGKAGRAWNGIGATSLFILIVTGLIVWWRGINNWSSGFRLSLKGTLRSKIWNIHSTVGAWVVPVLLVWSLSGFYFAFPAVFEKALDRVFPVSAQRNLQRAEESTNNSVPKKADLDQLSTIALSAVPEADAVHRIALADKRRNSIRIWLRIPNTDGTTQVHLDPATNKVFAISKAESPPSGDVILQCLIKFHFGTFFGTTSKCLWLFVGSMPALLSITALYLFVTGFKIRQKTKRD